MERVNGSTDPVRSRRADPCLPRVRSVPGGSTVAGRYRNRPSPPSRAPAHLDTAGTRMAIFLLSAVTVALGLLAIATPWTVRHPG